MRLVATRKEHQNTAVLDPWSLVHFSTGMAAGLVNVSWKVALVAAVGYEFVEQYAERHPDVKHLFGISGPETPLNAAIDVGLFMVGLHLGRNYNRS
jgi:hypothetical protein